MGQTQLSRPAGSSAQKRLLQIGLNRLVAQPDFGQRLVERVAADAPLGFAVQSDPRRTVHEIESDDILLLDLLQRLHDRRQRFDLRLDRAKLGGSIVLNQAFIEGIDELISGERAQYVELDTPRTLRQYASEVSGLLRQIQARDVDLEYDPCPYTRAVQDQLLRAHRHLVVELDASDLGGERVRRKHANG